MGLFGLFASMVGLGAMAKDGIDRSITESRQYEKAVRNGRSCYYVGNGSKTYATATRRQCSEVTDYNDTYHRWLIDTKTREKITDLTEELNIKRTEEKRREAAAKGSKFYRTAMFDCTPHWWSPVYVNDSMPGKYFDQVYDKRHGCNMYYEGELVDGGFGHKSNQRKEVKWKYGCKKYLPDGTQYK